MAEGKLVRREALSLACLVGLASPGTALERISPETFLDLAEDRLLTFHDFNDGSYVGTEEYLSRTLSVWKDTSGTCVYGEITVQDGRLCFLYDNDLDGLPVCWWTFRDGDRLFVRTARFRDVQNQEVVRIENGTLNCPAQPSV